MYFRARSLLHLRLRTFLPGAVAANACRRVGTLAGQAKEAAASNKTAWTSAVQLGLAGAVTGGALAAGTALAARGFEAEALGQAWVDDFVMESGLQTAVPPGRILSQNPLARMILDDDHLFEAMCRVGMVEGIQCYYNQSKREFHAIVKLGRDVCGYPSTVHGGLTAAIIDETLGGLMLSVWKSGVIGLLPAVTARLEVDYCKKVPQNSSVLCSTKVELIDGRKLWMTAEVRDKPNGTVYATARGLFVAPRIGNVIGDWVGNLLNGKS